MRMSGHSSRASEGVSRCISRPKLWAVVAWRSSSIMRSRVHASRSPPFIFQPVASPVSASMLRYSATEWPSSWVMPADVRSCPTRPAA